MKKKMSELTNQEQMETLDILYTAVSVLKGRDATKNFLKDLLTPSERIMLGRRIWIARMLLAGESQAKIGRILKVGPNTIWRVEKWLGDQLPGYEAVIAKVESEMKSRKEKRDTAHNPFTFKALKKKYPLHFLLFPSSKE